MGKRLSVKLPWPPSVNHYWKARGGGRFIAPRARAWLDGAVLLLRASGVRFDGQVVVRMYLSPPDRRKRDGDNLEKAIMDALVKAGVIVDDSIEYVKRSCKEVLGERKGYVLLEVEEA